MRGEGEVQPHKFLKNRTLDSFENVRMDGEHFYVHYISRRQVINSWVTHLPRDKLFNTPSALAGHRERPRGTRAFRVAGILLITGGCLDFYEPLVEKKKSQ